MSHRAIFLTGRYIGFDDCDRKKRPHHIRHDITVYRNNYVERPSEHKWNIYHWCLGDQIEIRKRRRSQF